MKKAAGMQSINHALYEARNKKNVSLKDAARSLKVTRLYLNLVEKGYVHVSKRMQPRFIKYYHLKNDFFKTNTTYVTPVNVQYEDPHLDEKIRNNIKKRRTKVVSGVASLLLIGVLATGLYYLKRDNINPRAMWTDDFTTFRENIINDPDGTEESEEFPGDTTYFIANEYDGYKVAIPGSDNNAAGLYVDFHSHAKEYDVVITTSVYNQKKIIIFEGEYKEDKVYAIATYTDNYLEYSLPKITLRDISYYPESAEYKEFVDVFLKEDAIYDSGVTLVNIVLTNRGLNYSFNQMVDDVQKISTYNVFGFRLGFRLTLVSAVLLVFALSVFVYALIKGRKLKPKKEKPKTYIVHKVEYTADAALVYRSVPNDTNFPMIIPECALRILALLALLLSSIGVTWLTQNILSGQESTAEALKLNAYVSNTFVTGFTLAFFLKLDVYHKKSNRELLNNIIALFVFGLIFYIAECITYACLSSQGNIYSDLIQLLSTLLPGNIIWNLMMYSLIFFFLFTLPKSLEDSPHKVLLWRLGSIIPSLLLLTAFIFKGTFHGVVSPYVSFLFHSGGVLPTAFAIFYLYSLFFFQQYVSLKYGKEFTKVFLDSRRYALSKNIIACIIIGLLTLMDLLFFFYLPINGLNLGNNWIIAILIPFILFYHPHIGKRAPKWDLAYTIMYVLFLIGGSLISFSMISHALDLGQISQIIS